MRVTGVQLCTLLLIGSSCAYPQYGGVQQEPLEPEVQVVQVVAAAPASDLTEQQVADLGNFWWQNQGIFDGQNAGATTVVVQEQGQNVPFTPAPSLECGDVPIQTCVPWGFCQDGVFTNIGQPLSALGSPSPVPESYSLPLCGQLGNVCCAIPDSILAAQQQGQSGGAGPFGGGDGGTEIIEVVSTAAGTVAIVEQVDGGSVSTGPYGNGGNTGGEIIEVISTAGLPEVTIVEQVSGGGDGTVAIVETPANDCNPYTQKCVPYFQCIEGEINIYGVGSIDLRVKPQSICTDPEYPEVPGICCNVPGATTPFPPTPAPLQTCPGNRVCVAEGQCNPDGTVNTDGAGNINVRLDSSCYLEYVDASNYVSGVCCEPPPPPVLDICPDNQACLTQGVCALQGTGTYNPSEVLACYEIGGAVGECCNIPPPTPVISETCPGSQICITQGFCALQGTAAYDPSEILACYQEGGIVGGIVGECCDPPLPPPPVDNCPGNQVCLSQGVCVTQSASTYNPDEVLACYHSGEVIGECCDPLPPQTVAPVTICPGTQDCVDQSICNADGTINTSGTGLLNLRVSHKKCYIDADAYTIGVCCQPPTPPPPPPVQTCPGNQICLSQGDCTSQSAATGGVVDSYTPCVLDADSYATGVCCTSPIRVVDVCPADSVCIPDLLCQGEILNDADEYLPYDSIGTWTQCSLSGGLNTPGVCCRNPAPLLTTPSPYTAANQCGVRNPGLDLRTKVLAKDEAHFGEFPWQAVIFFKNFTFKCGASIIEDRWLLTAAHCVNGYQYGDFKVRLGEWQVDRYDEPLKYVDVDIATIFIHPDFKPGPVHNDVALIELATPIVPQYHINSICLPNLNQIPAAGTRCFASGWGKDAFDGNYQAILKKVDVPVVEKNYCQDLLRKTRLGKYFVLDKSFMCAGGEALTDSCEGDGGGPLACEDPETGKYFVAGITAWGIGCGEKDVPGVYVDVQLFRPWIDGIIYPQQEQEQEQQQSSNPYGRK